MIYWIQGATQASPSITVTTGLIGAVVGFIGILIGQYLTQRRHNRALRQTAELEAQQGDRDALLRYFELVGQLLTGPSKSDSLMPVIQAQTLTLLEALEPGHKRILLHFLYELNLLDPEKSGLSLRGANLEAANLEDVNGRRANLEKANLRNANLAEANLRNANLKQADLSGPSYKNDRFGTACGRRIPLLRLLHKNIVAVKSPSPPNGHCEHLLFNYKLGVPKNNLP